MTDDFGVQTARSPFATFGGVVGIVLLLFVVAYTESFLRSLRRGRRQRTTAPPAVAGLVVVGLVGGLTAVLWGWMLRIAGPSFVAFVVSVACGRGRRSVGGVGWSQVGERTRARRQANRLVLVARRSRHAPAESSPVVGG